MKSRFFRGELPKRAFVFECSSLQPLRYASVYKHSLLRTNHMISSRSRYDLFDSPPYISTVFRALRKCKKNTQEQYEILKFDPAKTLINQGFSAEKTARANAHFECRTFDHSDNSPCISTVFRALRKCKKNRQERYEILKLELGKTLINQGFSAEKTARANAHFESVPL